MKDYQSLSHVRWEYKYHIVWVPKYRRKKLYGQVRRRFGEITRDLCRERMLDSGSWLPEIEKEIKAVQNLCRTTGDTPKNMALLKLIKADSEKVIIFVKYTATLDHLADFLGRNDVSFVLFHGGLPNEKKDAAIQAFKDNIQVLVTTVDSMNRRFQRDTASLDAYYQALEKEMRQNLNRSGLSQDLIREREEKIAMIPAELAAKKKDLLNKYGIRIDFKPAAALYLTSACVTVFARLISGRTNTDFSLTYNPVTKDMAPVAFQSCGTGTYSIGLSPNLHINCPDCLGLPATEH